jgi:hypothetical protein
MDKIGIGLTGLAIVIIIAMCALPPEAAPLTAAEEFELASAYHCGMLDALQEKRGRGRACDNYKEIARKKGVKVPP